MKALSGLFLALLLSAACVEPPRSYPSLHSGGDGISVFKHIIQRTREIEVRLRDFHGIKRIESRGFEPTLPHLMAYVRQLQVLNDVFEELRLECERAVNPNGCNRFNEFRGKIEGLRFVLGNEASAAFKWRSKTLVLSLNGEEISESDAGEIFGINYRYGSEARPSNKYYSDILEARDLQKALLVDRIVSAKLSEMNFLLRKSKVRKQDVFPAADGQGISYFYQIYDVIVSTEEALRGYGFQSFIAPSLDFDPKDIAGYAGQLDLVLSSIRSGEYSNQEERVIPGVNRIVVENGPSPGSRIAPYGNGSWELRLTVAEGGASDENRELAVPTAIQGTSDDLAVLSDPSLE